MGDKRISDHVCSTLARVLSDAKAGSVDAVIIVAVSPAGAPMVHFGGEAELIPSINLGLDLAKQSFLGQAISAPGAVQMNSGLIKARN